MKIVLDKKQFTLVCLGGPRAKAWEGEPTLDRETGLPLYTYRVSLSDGTQAFETELLVTDSTPLQVHERIDATGLALEFSEYVERDTNRKRKTWKLTAGSINAEG